MADGYNFTITIIENSYSIPNNTSDVSVNIKVNRPANATGAWSSYASTLTVICDGQKKTKTISNYDFRGNPQIDLGTFTYTINHNSDGSKTVSVSADWNPTNSALNSGNGVQGSASKKLTTIPRASDFTISGSQLGSLVTITINRKSESFTHEITYKFVDNTSYSVASSATTSATFTPPISLASKIPNATKGTLTVTVQTKSGSSNIGSAVSKSIDLSVPSSIVPSVSFSYTIMAGLIPAEWGIILKGQTMISVNVSASGNYGSTISNVSITCDGVNKSGSYNTFGPFVSAGQKSISVTVIDSRGRSASSSQNFNVTDYQNPSISINKAQRCLKDGTLSTSGTYILFNISYTYASIEGKNTITKSISCASGLNSNFENGVDFILNANASASQSYTATATIRDYLGKSATVTYEIPTDTRLININEDKNSIGIGKFAEEDNTLDVAWNLRLREGMSVDKPDIIPFLYREPWWNDGSGQNVDDDISGIHFAYPSHGTPGYGTVATFSCFGKNDWAYPFQLQGCYTNNRLYYRSKFGNNGWKAWSEIAFVGDAISNANGASLANAYIPNNSNLMGVRSDGTKRRFLTMLSNNQMYICYDGDNAYFGGDIYGQKNKLVAYDDSVVHDSGNESISGVKTFTGGIVIPNFNASSLQSTSGYRAIATPVAQPFIDYMKPTDNGSSKYLHVQISGWGAYGINMWASDRELKKDIVDSTVTAIETINKIKHRAFKWKENDIENKNGYIAQELEEINPDFVLKIPQTEDNDSFSYQINETIIIPYITKAIQEVFAMIEDQQKQINELKEQINNLKSML